MHHFSTLIRILKCSLAINTMKKLAEITFYFIVLLGIQVVLYNFLHTSRDHHFFAKIGCSGIIKQDYWNKQFADDNEVEPANQLRPIVTVKQPGIVFKVDIYSRPKQANFLNPLFFDRPPPSFCQ